MNDLVMHLVGSGRARPDWYDDAGVVMLGCAAALFVVAGVVRLARWRIARDPHSALVGCALVVMGGLYLPLVGIAEVGGALDGRQAGDAAIRALVTFLTVGLVVRGMHATGLRPFERPSRLLPVLAVVILTAFAALAYAETALSVPAPVASRVAQALSAAMVVGWYALAVATLRHRGVERPWSRRSAPLFVGLAVAEVLYGTDPGAPLGTGLGLLLCTTIAAVAVWSANRDLEAALHQTERTIGSLSQTLRTVRGEAEELNEWRAQLVHDAGNAVAGLRAAIDVLDARQAAADAPAARLCHAAAAEARHLAHLLNRSPTAPPEPFDAGPVVRGVGLTARTLGQDVTVEARRTPAVGCADDLVTVLKNLLVNAARHAPGAAVSLTVEQTGGVVRIVCQDRGPGVDEQVGRHLFERGVRGPSSQGTGLGLHEARTLMRAQGGDLVLEPAARGARFVATLPAAEVSVPPVATHGSVVPRQRAAADAVHVTGLQQGIAR